MCLFAGTTELARASSGFVSIPGVTLERQPQCNGVDATIVGTDRPDVILGTPGADVIVGLAGDDIILGLGGNDTIRAGPGEDVVKGGPGARQIFPSGQR